MVLYRRKRTYRKGTLKRLTKPRKTTAIQSLAKEVMKIKRTMKRKTEIYNYTYGTRQLPGAGSIGEAIIAPYYAFHINPFNSWARVFGTGANDQESNSMIWKSFGMDVHIRSYSETSEVNFTMFIVSATDNAADRINNSTGALTITELTDYINSSASSTDTAAGLVMLNKKMFKIHAIRRFTLGNNSVAFSTSTAQTQFGTDRRFYFKLRPNKKVVNASGDVFGLSRDVDPSGNYYVLIFSNNGSGDVENPRVFINAVHTVEMLN